MNTSTIFILVFQNDPEGTYDDNFAPSCATTLGLESPKAFKPPSAKKNRFPPNHQQEDLGDSTHSLEAECLQETWRKLEKRGPYARIL